MPFQGVDLADGEFTAINLYDSAAVLLFKDFREKTFEFRFSGVIYLEVRCALGAEIDGCRPGDMSEFVGKMNGLECEGEFPLTSMTYTEFFGVYIDKPVISICYVNVEAVECTP